MNLYQYCQKNNLDISQLSKKSISALGGMYLENVNPTQERINRLAKIDAGKLTPDQALQETLAKYKQH